MQWQFLGPDTKSIALLLNAASFFVGWPEGNARCVARECEVSFSKPFWRVSRPKLHQPAWSQAIHEYRERTLSSDRTSRREAERTHSAITRLKGCLVFCDWEPLTRGTPNHIPAPGNPFKETAAHSCAVFTEGAACQTLNILTELRSA